MVEEATGVELVGLRLRRSRVVAGRSRRWGGDELLTTWCSTGGRLMTGWAKVKTVDEARQKHQAARHRCVGCRRSGVRLLMQTALEAEVEVFLGRARYARAAVAEDARPGCRNGYSPATVKTTAGPVTWRGRSCGAPTEAFASRLFGTSVTRTNALESLVIAGFVRGLSVRDVENTLADALGAEAALSKSTVSRVCQAIGTSSSAWAARRLDERRAGLPVPGRLDVQDAPRRPRRAGAGGVGHHHRRQAGVRRPGRRRRRVHRRLGRLPRRAARAGGCARRCWSSPTAPPG